MITFVFVGVTFGLGIFAAGIWLGYQIATTPGRIDLGNLDTEAVQS